MSFIDPETTLDQFLRSAPGRRGLLRRLGIDFECEPNRSLAEACRQHGLHWQTFARLLAAFRENDSAPVAAMESQDLSMLCDHIESAQSARLQEELAHLDRLTNAAVEQAGAADDSPLLKIREVFVDFRDFFTAHLGEETEEIFPTIRHWANDDGHDRLTQLALRRRMVRLRSEHNQADETLAQLRVLTEQVASRHAESAAIQAVAEGVARLELALHEQIFEEDQILFRRVLATRIST